MRYLLYARKSSESEDRQVQSIDDQLSVLREFAAQRGLTVIEELIEAQSAKAPGTRPIFADVLNNIRSGKADGILCWSINRLSRNPVDSGTLSWLLQQGVLKSIRTVDREYLPEDNVLLMAVESGVANQFIIDLKKATIRGLESKVAKGWAPQKAPPGYQNNSATGTIEVDEPSFRLLRRAWDLMLAGTHSVPQVLEEVRGWGCPIIRSTLYNVLTNPFYYGSFKYNGVLYPGKHRPMVTKQEFDIVQHILRRPDQIRPHKHRFAYTGLIHCGVCGCLITAERRVKHYPTTGNTSTYLYYHCTGNKGCSKEAVSESYIEGEITKLLERVSIKAEFGSWLEDLDARVSTEGPAHFRDITSEQQGAIRRTRQRLARLLELRLQGEISKEEFQSYKERCQAELNALEQKKREFEARFESARQTLENAIRFSTTASQDFAEGALDVKREIAAALGVKYVLTLRRLKIRPHPILDRIRTFEPRKGPSQQVRAGVSSPASPGWLRLLKDIRKLITEKGVTFPALQAWNEKT